jgi:pilus assembly protein CpaF
MAAFSAGVTADFLRWAVVNGANVLVSGGTGAGKTTLLNALAAAIPPTERLVTIEETAELRLPLPHVVRLEGRPPNAEGAGAVSVRALVRAALRMRPDRLVIGEVRGAEALDLLQALNTGHDGSLSTIHANDPTAALSRLETLSLLAATGLPLSALRAQIDAAIDLVVHVARRQATRWIEMIGEVRSTPERVAVVPLFARRGDALVSVGKPTRAPRRAGVVAPDADWFAC